MENISMSEDKTTVNGIVDNLIDVVGKIIEYKSMIAMGLPLPKEVDYSVWNKPYQQELMDLAKPMIQNAQQGRVLEAESSRDIIKLLGQGKINFKEAASLLELMKDKAKLEEQEIKNKMQKDLADLISN